MTESQTYSKCGVPPRITTPRQATASWCLASSAATTGSSIAPGTRTTNGSGTPHTTAAAVARASSESVISACHRVAAIARLSPDASTAAPSGRPTPLIGYLPPVCSRRLRFGRDRRPHRAGVQRDGRWDQRPFGLVEVLNLMTESVALGDQVAQVVHGNGGGQRDPRGDVNTAIGQAAHLGWVVCEQAHRTHAQVGEHPPCRRPRPVAGRPAAC